MVSSRTWVLTLITMIGFSANSILCREALRHTATFTLVRIASDALVLVLLLRLRRSEGGRAAAAAANRWPGLGDGGIDHAAAAGDFVAIDGKAPLHLVSAFATTARLVLGQEAVSDKSNEISAIPVLVERLAANGGLKGAIVSIDAIACNTTIAAAIKAAGAEYLLAVKSNQARLRTGHGAKNMAIVRHFAINLVRAVADKKSIKLRRKAAGWDVRYLETILGLSPR